MKLKREREKVKRETLGEKKYGLREDIFTHRHAPLNFSGTVATRLLLFRASLLSEFAWFKNFKSAPFNFPTMCV